MSKKSTTGIWKVISASSMGTMIEWYDFYIFGSLATLLSTKFFPPDNPTAAFLSTLATFAAGFVVRPFGAIFFGRLGDLIGRKYTFMVTLLLMGGATFLIGCVPSYETIGFFAPLLVLILRLLQGLALGGEYGGAATYVAEHSPNDKRGFFTSWIQTTATIGLFISLIVIYITRHSLSKEDFTDWGWRIPFWVSIIMIVISYVIRKNMHESPVFAKVKSEGKVSTNPLKESFGNKLNFKFVLLALFGATMGQGVVWYTGQFYAMSFIEKTMSIDKDIADNIMLISLALGTPFFIFFGWLSDKMSRKWIMMAGMLIAIVSYRPIYTSMYESASEKSMKAAGASLVIDSCKVIGKPLAEIKTEKDKKDPSITKTKIIITTKSDSLYNTGAKFHYTTVDTLFTEKPIVFDSKANAKNEVWIKYNTTKNGIATLNTIKLKNTLKTEEAPAKVDTLSMITLKTFTDTQGTKYHPAGVSLKHGVEISKNITDDVKWHLILLVLLQVLFVTMVYGPIAAFLVEMFPAKIRYTSMSLPYHVGNGIFGGLLPAVATFLALNAKKANDIAKEAGTALPFDKPYLEGLWYPIIVASVCLVIGVIYLKSNDKNAHD
ncbi:MFS transporter [Flavobacterium sp.]|jgi:MFS family permease|uniref:MFS transporter n=1 Tax=Flavobacterium sp. TaxID=239 RepID=UPI0022BE5C83|nr:MFS transporter [Flavobacterium sp.]MCZ8230248.1 MFS transporter [Flavobacterium sp.]